MLYYITILLNYIAYNRLKYIYQLGQSLHLFQALQSCQGCQQLLAALVLQIVPLVLGDPQVLVAQGILLHLQSPEVRRVL